MLWADLIQRRLHGATRERTLWITGKMSPRARTELAANGWSVREGPIP